LPLHSKGLSATCHDVKDDTQAPDVCRLRYVGDSHENLGRRVRVAATVRLAAFELSVDRVHVGARKTEIDHFDVALKHDVTSLIIIANPLQFRGNYSATSNDMKLVHWPLMGGLLHLVKRRGIGRGRNPPRTLLAVPNVTAHPPTASVPIIVLVSVVLPF